MEVNIHRNNVMGIINFFGFEMFFAESSDEEEEEHCKKIKKIKNFCEDLVLSMDTKQFKMHFRLTVEAFEDLVQKLYVSDENVERSVGHPMITTEKPALITIWYLGNIESFRSVANRFGVTKSTCWKEVYKTCRLLLKVNAHFKIICWPSEHNANNITNEFERRFGFPGVLGVIDGTHVRINAPKLHHASYVNRKSYHSVLLQGVCDHNYRFIDAFTGFPGSLHDQMLLINSDLYTRIQNNDIQFTHNRHLIGDKAYRLSYLLVPFKENINMTRRQKNYNIILSKTRAVIENTFSLLKGRFRRLKFVETVHLDLVALLIISTCILHNVCLLKGDNMLDEIDVNNAEERINNDADDIVAGEGDINAIQKRIDIINNLPLI